MSDKVRRYNSKGHQRPDGDFVHLTDYQSLQSELEQVKAENERLNKLLTKEFNENDELGLEYTGIVILKSELQKEREAAKGLVEALNQAVDFIHKSGQDCTAFEFALAEYQKAKGQKDE